MSRNAIIAGFAAATVLAVGLGFVSTTVLGRLIQPDGEVASAPAVAAAGPTARPRTQAAPRLKSADQYLDVVMGQNIFDEGARTYWASRKPGAAGDSSGGDSEAPSDLKVTLLGTVVTTPEEFSSALILENGKDHAVGYGIGDKLYDRKVVEIAQKKVTLERGNGEREILTMEEEERPTRSTASISPQKSGVSTSISTCGSRALTASTTARKWALPPSGRSSRLTDVMTTCSRPSSAVASATAAGSLGSSGAGRAVPTAQNPQARVQSRPMMR